MTKEAIRAAFEDTNNRLLESISETAYELYKADWCKSRGYDLEEVEKANANDEEYNGEMFVCFGEFQDCEFQDEEYMKYLLPKWMYNLYRAAVDTYTELSGPVTKTAGVGDTFRITFPNAINISKISFFDELEYESWGLFCKYCNELGIELHPTNPHDNIDFAVAKRIQDTVLDILTEAGVKIIYRL